MGEIAGYIGEQHGTKQLITLEPHGTTNGYTVPTPVSDPGGITAGPDRALWFTESYGNKIGRIVP